jgi:tryptophan synthase beta subunit
MWGLSIVPLVAAALGLCSQLLRRTLCCVHVQELTKTVPAGARIVLCCSGRGDKDVNAAMRYFDMESGQIRDNLDQLT